MSVDNHTIMFRDEDELYKLIKNEIDKKYTYKQICKDIIKKTEFEKNQCFYMCNENIKSIKTCKNNSIDNIIVKSRQIKKLKILKKTFVSDEEKSVITVANTKIDGLENKVIIKDFHDEYEMMYELFIANILKSDEIIKNHICGYYGKKKDDSKLILEYIEGKTLTEMKHLTMKDFSDIISQIFLLLNYAYNKYGFLHGDLHTENFLILQNKNPDKQFDIKLPLSNGKFIKYKSNYKLVFIDFGLSHIKFKFNKNNKIINARLMPFDEDVLGFDNSVPIIDISKLLVFIMVEIVYENKHKKLSEIGIYITNLIQNLYSIIGLPTKNINSNFFYKSRNNYGYIYDLINSDLELSFEELYIKFVNDTKMDIHKIQDYFNEGEFKKIDTVDEIEDTYVVTKIINNITNENIKLNEKIEKIVEFIKDLKKLKLEKDGKISNEQFKYIYLNLFQYTCKYELNKNIFNDESDMILTINKIYNKFVENKIIHNIKENEKYKVIDNLIEFKLNKFLDCFLKNIDIHNILNKYNKLNEITNEQIEKIESQNLNKIFKKLLIKNYNKLPYKIFQTEFIDSEINIKKFNEIEQIKFLSNIVYQIKNQTHKLNISIKNIDLKLKNNNFELLNRSQLYKLHIFFYNIYKYCEKNSFNILENSKKNFIDWISYNKIILYDYYIRHLSLTNVPNEFIKIYFEFIELEDEIWEKFYKKDNFNNFANTLTFSENMLEMLINKDLSNLIYKLNFKNDSIKQNITKLNLTNENINDIVKPFKKIYVDF